MRTGRTSRVWNLAHQGGIGLVLASMALALIPFHGQNQTKYPAAPEENLLVIRVTHRDAGEVARIVEDVLRQSLPAEQQAMGILTVDPKLNAIIVRAAGPGATWPTTVKSMVTQLDQATEAATLTVTLWRKGWAADRPRGEKERAETEAVLGEAAGEKLDSFRIPVEIGTFFSGWLAAPGKPAVRVVGVVGANQRKAPAVRLIPLRIEVVDSRYSGAPPAPLGAPTIEEIPAPGQGEGVKVESSPPSVPSGKEEKPPAPVNPQASPAARTALAEAQPPTASQTPKGEKEAAETEVILPPPYGEVVFAGPVTAEQGQPAVVGPFSVPNLEGQLVVSVALDGAKSSD